MVDMKHESIVCCDGTMKNKSVKYGIRIQKKNVCQIIYSENVHLGLFMTLVNVH